MDDRKNDWKNDGKNDRKNDWKNDQKNDRKKDPRNDRGNDRKDALKNLAAYELLAQSYVKEVDSESFLLEHRKSGARLFLLSNSDNNKVFSIGFRTPPPDSTGVPHIMEHSVLCGSEKFPVKDPFVELAKGSLNTFLNAVTYPDKTVYPVASTNDKDFRNLMDVYMDAVLHPNIYREEKIFKQEGWHYELESADAPLRYNGVVYNEMKGAFSSPESVLDRWTQNTLFPDVCYGVESGGDPAAIPDLTYEQFLHFHQTYYHPANSYIYLYGDMDMAERLTWLDEAYLSKYDRRDPEAQVDSEIRRQQPFAAPKQTETTYSITDEEPEENAAYLSVSTVVGDRLDPVLFTAMEVLEYALIDAPGAALKQALLDAGIGGDIFGGFADGILQPYFTVTAKDADAGQKEAFLEVVKGTLRKLADGGLNKKSLLAGINYYEFQNREADYGWAPKGLMYGLRAMDSWLYGEDPLMFLRYEDTFAFLRKAVDEGYFEQLIRDWLLDNPYEAVVVVKPERNKTEKEDARVAKKLADYKASLSAGEIGRLVEQTRELKAYQDAPSPKEDLEKIPMLKREDISPEAEENHWKESVEHGVPVLYHEHFTSGICYVKVLFHTDRVPVEDLPYVGLLKSVMGSVDTEHYSYADLSSEIHLKTGGIGFSTHSYADLGSFGDFTGMFEADVKTLYDRIPDGMALLAEILSGTKFTDAKRLGEVLRELRSRLRMKLEGASHGAAVSRAMSYFSAASKYNDLTGGIGFYRFLEDTVKSFEKDPEPLIERLKSAAARLFTTGSMLVSVTADAEGFGPLPEALKVLTDALPAGSGETYPFSFERANRNEGFKTSSQVNYVARCGNFREKGYEYTGALQILKPILNYDYLWINLRVKGGAYGCMSGFGRSGDGYFASFRDPNLRETNEVYENVAAYLENFDADERDMTKYVIGTISEMDTPLSPSAKGDRELSAYLSHVTNEMLAEERAQVLAAQPEDIRALAPVLKAVLETGSLCVIGNGEKVEANREMFGEVKALFRG